MRILVISDSHCDRDSLRSAIEAQPRAHTILFLGDGVRDMESEAPTFPKHKVYAVRGNCDLACMEPAVRVLQVGDKRIMMTHGHTFAVDFGIGDAVDAARRNGCDVLAFGHTHTPMTDYQDGLYIINPGSIARWEGQTYGVIDIVPGGIMCNTISL